MAGIIIQPTGILSKEDIEVQLHNIEVELRKLKRKIAGLDRAQIQSVRFVADCLDTIRCMLVDTQEMIDTHKIG